MGPQVLLPPGAGLVLEQVSLRGEFVYLSVRCRLKRACCPTYGNYSDAVHSRYTRRLGDLPVAGRLAIIHLARGPQKLIAAWTLA